MGLPIEPATAAVVHAIVSSSKGLKSADAIDEITIFDKDTATLEAIARVSLDVFQQMSLKFVKFSDSLIEVTQPIMDLPLERIVSLQQLEDANRAVTKRSSQLRVFISHSSVDKWFAREICRRLEEIPVTVFLDEKDIEFGWEIADSLRDQLVVSDVVLVILSSNSAKSDWVKYEIGAAWALQKRIMPIKLNGEVELKLIGGLRYVDATNQLEAVRSLEESIAKLSREHEPT